VVLAQVVIRSPRVGEYSTRCWAGSADLRRELRRHGTVDSESRWPGDGRIQHEQGALHDRAPAGQRHPHRQPGGQRPSLADHQHPQRLVPRGPQQHQRHLRQRQADQEACLQHGDVVTVRPPPAALRRGRRPPSRTNSKRPWSSSPRPARSRKVRAAPAAHRQRHRHHRRALGNGAPALKKAKLQVLSAPSPAASSS
jgi:hypothetical protein